MATPPKKESLEETEDDWDLKNNESQRREGEGDRDHKRSQLWPDFDFCNKRWYKNSKSWCETNLREISIPREVEAG